MPTVGEMGASPLVQDHSSFEPASTKATGSRRSVPKARQRRIERKTRRAVGRCAFCGARQLTTEHLFSKPVRDAVTFDVAGSMDDLALVQWSPLRTAMSGPSGSVLVPPQSKREIRASCACGRCNSGWMQDLDRRIAPTLHQLALNPSAVGFSEGASEERSDLSAWFAKIAVVSEYLRSDAVSVFAPPTRSFLARCQTPHPSTAVHIGSIAPVYPPQLHHIPAVVEAPPPAVGARANALVVMVILHKLLALVVHFAGIGHSGTSSLPGFSQLWPPPPQFVPSADPVPPEVLFSAARAPLVAAQALWSAPAPIWCEFNDAEGNMIGRVEISQRGPAQVKLVPRL